MRNSSKLTGDNPQVHSKTASIKDSCDSNIVHSDDEYVNIVSKHNHAVINMNLPTQRQQVVKTQEDRTPGNQANATSESLTGLNRTWFLRVSSAAFYAFASFMIMVVNKRILTVYKFPSFQVLGIGQMLSTIIILWISRRLDIVSFASFSPSIVKKIWPLPLFYVGKSRFVTCSCLSSQGNFVKFT